MDKSRVLFLLLLFFLSAGGVLLSFSETFWVLVGRGVVRLVGHRVGLRRIREVVGVLWREVEELRRVSWEGIPVSIHRVGCRLVWWTWSLIV